MRIVFMGTPRFAVPVLEALLASDHKVVAVVTGVDKRAGRRRQLRESAVKQVAKRHNLPILQPDDFLDPPFLQKFAEYRADIGVVVAFRILPPEMFNIPQLGCVNLHASLLPDLRGAAPINWALMRGYERTGVTTFQIARRVDRGNLLMQESVDINPDDNVDDLAVRLANIGAKLMVKTLDGLKAGTVTAIKQTGPGSDAPKITRETCLVDWTRPADQLHNQVRGLAPNPAAFTLLDSRTLKLYRSRIIDRISSGDPGTVMGVIGDALCVQTGEGVLGLLEVQLEGRKRMNTTDFLRGSPVPNGTQLEM